MSILRTLRRMWGQRHYEAAQTNRHNAMHWKYASNEDANSLIEASLSTLRNRVRYEVRNNSYAHGIIDTLANDVVGVGPRPQVTTLSEKSSREIENSFMDWAADCDITGRLNLAELLRLAVWQWCESGESLFIKHADADGFKLMMLEPDYLADPWGFDQPNVEQGIKINAYGRPVEYYLWREHPGSHRWMKLPNDFVTVPAEQVIHVFRTERPGQMRAVPWLVPALPLFAQLRRFTAATVQAAETSADYSSVMESTSPDLTPATVTSLDEVQLSRNMMLTLPAGWRMNQLRPEHPANTYPMFKHEILNEIARCVNMPYNIAAANSSSYNYASGRMDHQIYFRFISCIRDFIAQKLLRPFFETWLQDFRYAYQALPENSLGTVKVEWNWQGTEHVDPEKEANAQATMLSDGMTNYAAEYAKQGKDWQNEFAQAAKELGITVEEYQAILLLKLMAKKETGTKKNESTSKVEQGVDEDDANQPTEQSVGA